MSFITEGDLYRLIVHSKLPSAERFERWIFDEVLPTIRKHGAYMTDSVLEQVIENPGTIYSLAELLLEDKARCEELTRQLKDAKPKAEYFDSFIRADGCICIMFLQDVLFTMYHPVNTKFNPYIDTDYVERRVQDRQIRSATGIYRGIWNRQNGTCYYCGRKILIDQKRTVVEVDGSKSRKAARLAYVHVSCLSTSFESINALELPESWTDVMKLLQQLDFNRKPLLAMKMLPLSEFFRTCSKHSVTLTFKEMEEIMGEELGVGADQKSFCYRAGFNNISQCWLDNGYQIKQLHLTDRKRVVFVQTSESRNTACVEIPEVIQHGRIPDAAKYELENYFQYIIRKYGL